MEGAKGSTAGTMGSTAGTMGSTAGTMGSTAGTMGSTAGTKRSKKEPPLIVYDSRVESHKSERGPHPECPDRTQSIYKRIRRSGTLAKCTVEPIPPSEVRLDRLLLTHTVGCVGQVMRWQSDPDAWQDLDSVLEKQKSLYVNNETFGAAILSAAGVAHAAKESWENQKHSFAIVRPPGHHASRKESSGFCLFNNVAHAIHSLREGHPDVGRVAVVDWDVHHGDGTQKIFYGDPDTLVINVHVYERDGSFFPHSRTAEEDHVGDGNAAGRNVNIPWTSKGRGDVDYMEAWNRFVIPMLEEFSPDITFVSAGFDAADGDPLGGCKVTPGGYANMTNGIIMATKGRPVVMALEGGYNLSAISHSALACVRALVADDGGDYSEAPHGEEPVHENTRSDLQLVTSHQTPFWSYLGGRSPLDGGVKHAGYNLGGLLRGLFGRLGGVMPCPKKE
jgi:acetoin utilization deacetylase AcuC-like enzyme